MKKIHITLIPLLFFALTISASSIEDASDAYKKQEYTKAAAIYEEILTTQGSSASLYYNLGNAYYKSKQYPKSILNYERGLLLSPGDENLRVNLEMAYSKITDKIEPLERSFISVWLESLQNMFSSNIWATAGIISFIMFLAGLYLYFFTRVIWVKKLGFFGGMLLLMLSILSNRFAYLQKEKITVRDQAIIMAPSISVKSSPASSGTDLFILHEGVKVKVTDKVGEWSEIRIDDGNTGWLQTSKIEII